MNEPMVEENRKVGNCRKSRRKGSILFVYICRRDGFDKFVFFQTSRQKLGTVSLRSDFFRPLLWDRIFGDLIRNLLNLVKF